MIVTSLAGILVFTSATQGWFINRLRWYEIIIFLFISISLLSPEFVLNKFYPKYEYVDFNKINEITLDPKNVKSGEIYNLSDDYPCSNIEVANYAYNLMGVEKPKMIDVNKIKISTIYT